MNKQYSITFYRIRDGIECAIAERIRARIDNRVVDLSWVRTQRRTRRLHGDELSFEPEQARVFDIAFIKIND